LARLSARISPPHLVDQEKIAYLKRALDHLHKSQAGLEAAALKNLLPATMIAEARKELFEIREGILHLMDEFRGAEFKASPGGAM